MKHYRVHLEQVSTVAVELEAEAGESEESLKRRAMEVYRDGDVRDWEYMNPIAVDVTQCLCCTDADT